MALAGSRRRAAAGSNPLRAPLRPAHLAGPLARPDSGLFARNPRYAGAFAWGRRRDTAPTWSLQDRWQVLLPNSHVGYIDWERFVANQAILARNYLPFRDRQPAPRQGCALLQSRALCGRCGGRILVRYVRYEPRDGSEPTTHAYWLECQADLAAQRCFAVDPLNRTVAARLECDWNDCLRSVEQARREHERLAEADRCLLTVQACQRIGSLAQDFSRIWHAPRTQPAGRKRMLAAILADVTPLRSPHICRVQMRFHAGAPRTVEVPLPCGARRLHAAQPELVALVARLSADRNCPEVAAAINRPGYTAYQGRPFTAAGIRRILRANGLPLRTERLRARGFVSARELARTLGVSRGTVRNWADRGILDPELIAQGPQRSQALYAVPEGADVAEILGNKGKRNDARPGTPPNKPNCHAR